MTAAAFDDRLDEDLRAAVSRTLAVPSRSGHPHRHCLVDRALCGAFPRRDIAKGDELYMRRFFLTPPGRGPRQVFLHHILRDDDDRALHCHPWGFTSFILAGGYVEHLPGGMWQAHYAGAVLRRRATHAHRVVIIKPVWSLVVAGPAERVWGFHDPERGWTDWRTYLGLPDAPDWPEDRIR